MHFHGSASPQKHVVCSFAFVFGGVNAIGSDVYLLASLFLAIKHVGVAGRALVSVMCFVPPSDRWVMTDKMCLNVQVTQTLFGPSHFVMHCVPRK
jgi:hypothetical protein